MDTERWEKQQQRVQFRILNHGVGPICGKFSVGIMVKGTFDATEKNNEVAFRVFTKSFSYPGGAALERI